MNKYQTKSKVKSKLSKKDFTLGTWLTIPSTAIVDILGIVGFEWFVIDMEHSHFNNESILNLISQGHGNNLEVFVRVDENNPSTIKRVLDAGADGIIVPLVKTPEEAQNAVDATRYPPSGKRGVGLNRAQGYGAFFEEYKNWHHNLKVIPQIEHIDAVKNLDKILKVKGVDGIIVGPYDLSASMGSPGEYSKNEVKKVLDEIEKTTLRSEKSLGFHVVEPEGEIINKLVSKGYNFLAFSLDFKILIEGYQNEINKIK